MVDWPVEVNVFLVGHHVAAKIWQRHLVHYVQHEALDRDVHVLREVHLVKLIEHLLEAVEEGVTREDANSFLSPNLVVVFELRMFKFTLEAARAHLIEEENSSIAALTL